MHHSLGFRCSVLPSRCGSGGTTAIGDGHADRHRPAPGSTPLVCGSESGSRLKDALICSLASGLLLTAALVVTFSEIKPKDVPYLPRAGCEWYEGRLNGCAGLTAVPHQPFNTYSTVMFAIAGTFSAFYFAANSSIDRRAATQETRSRRLTTRAYGNKVRWSR